MAWADGDLKLLAVGMAIGERWNCAGRVGLPPPTAEPPGGDYYGAVQYVTLYPATEGAVVRYTTDGSAPGAVGQIFDGQTVEVDRTMTIRAYAQVSNLTSAIADFVYRMENPFDVTENVVLARAMVAIADGGVVIGTEYRKVYAEDTVDLARVLPVFSDDAVVQIVTG